VVGDDIAEFLEPKVGQLRQDLASPGNARIKNMVERADPIGGDQDQCVGCGIDVPDFSSAQKLTIRDYRGEQSLGHDSGFRWVDDGLSLPCHAALVPGGGFSVKDAASPTNIDDRHRLRQQFLNLGGVALVDCYAHQTHLTPYSGTDTLVSHAPLQRLAVALPGLFFGSLDGGHIYLLLESLRTHQIGGTHTGRVF
jgi:hypothetical protein